MKDVNALQQLQNLSKYVLDAIASHESGLLVSMITSLVELVISMGIGNHCLIQCLGQITQSNVQPEFAIPAFSQIESVPNCVDVSIVSDSQSKIVGILCPFTKKSVSSIVSTTFGLI